MIPQSKIDGWSLAHDRDVRDLTRMTAVMHKELYHERFPSDVMVAGENWLYIAELRYVGEGSEPAGEGLALDWSSAFTITPKKVAITTRYLPLGKLFDILDADLAADETALFPLTRQRQDEADSLGVRDRERDDWYTIQRTGGKIIKVFPITPKFKTVYLGRLADGSNIGYTPMNREPPIGQ